MGLLLTNTLGGHREPFRPIEAGRVRMYHCGPTVKEDVHIGKFRSYLLADVLRRHLEASGFNVLQVMNITDVGHLNEFEEDVVEVAAARRGMHGWELAERSVKQFHQDRRALNILEAHEYPHAREHVDAMVEMVRELEAKGVCYRAGGNLYLDVSHHQKLGELTGRTLRELEDLQKSTRTVPHPEKRHVLDIDLWRTDALHEMGWDSPWGHGFPGWHVECAAMSRRYLGESFDIHTGTDENIFPHHECEIAQAEILSGRPMASYWLHTGPVNVDGRPMKPANGNLVTVRDLLDDGCPGAAVRVALLSARYRDTLDFDETTLDRAENAVRLIQAFHHELREVPTTDPVSASSGEEADWIQRTRNEIREALDDDLDITRAITTLTETLERLEPDDVGPPPTAVRAVEEWDRVLGVL